MSTAPTVTAVSTPGRPRPVTPVGLMAEHLREALDLLDTVPDDPRIRECVARAHALAVGLDPYLEASSSAESPALRGLAAATAAHDWTAGHRRDGAAPLEQEMLSGHVEGRLLQLLVHVTRAHQVLEVGMFTGYSALALAEALPSHGRVVACEIDPEPVAIARRAFAASPAGARVDVRLGPALTTLATLAEAAEAFDLVFLDADKAGYLDYVHAVLDHDLLAAGGLIVVDNTLMQGLPWTDREATPNATAVAAFNAAIAADPRLDQVVVPLRDGLTLIRRVDR